MEQDDRDRLRARILQLDVANRAASRTETRVLLQRMLELLDENERLQGVVDDVARHVPSVVLPDAPLSERIQAMLRHLGVALELLYGQRREVSEVDQVNLRAAISWVGPYRPSRGGAASRA